MRYQLVLAAALALTACASGGPSPPNRPPAAVSPPAGSSSPPSYGLRVAALPTRSAGAAFATAGEEHALVWQSQTLPAATSPTLPQAVRSPSSKGASIAAGLPARVLEVHAAYQRWCAGASLPEDDVLLASAGGLRLAGAVACERSSTPSRPRRLVPDPG